MGIRTIGLCLAILLLTAAPRGADRVIRLTDVAAAAGIDLLNIAGSPAKDLVMDANGNGAAWFDLRPGRRSRPAHRQWIALRAVEARRRSDGGAVPQRRRRKIHERDARGRPRPAGLGDRCVRRRLRQRWVRGRLHHGDRAQRALAQHGPRHVHHGTGEAADRDGAPAAPSATTTGTGCSTCTSRTMSSSMRARVRRRARRAPATT